MRLDADEIVELDLASEMEASLPKLPVGVTGVYLKRKHIFLGRWIRHGGTAIELKCCCSPASFCKPNKRVIAKRLRDKAAYACRAKGRNAGRASRLAHRR